MAYISYSYYPGVTSIRVIQTSPIKQTSREYDIVELGILQIGISANKKACQLFKNTLG
jgi:hypothetical protein